MARYALSVCLTALFLFGGIGCGDKRPTDPVGAGTARPGGVPKLGKLPTKPKETKDSDK